MTPKIATSEEDIANKMEIWEVDLRELEDLGQGPMPVADRIEINRNSTANDSGRDQEDQEHER